MAFNFPDSPTPGQIFTDAASGAQYVYASGVWMQSSAAQIRLTAQVRNRVVNGAMQVSQENGNAVGTVNGYYAADQWTVVFGTTGTLNIQRVQVVTPNGSGNRLRVAVATADTSLAAGEVALIEQKIEGIRIAESFWSTASARQMILRFGFKAPAGTYAVSIQNGAGNRSYIVLVTIAAGQANTDTTQTLIIPGDTTGAWAGDTSVGIDLRITLAAGTSFNGVVGWQGGNFISTTAVTNGLATAGNIFELFDVGLYLDDQATGAAPPWQMPDEAQELAACQRYYQNTFTLFSGNVTSASAYLGSGFLAVKTRIAPAVSGSSVVNAGFGGTSGAFANIGAGGIAITENRAATATQAGFFQSVVTANARM